jgi:hypothetical protein
MMKIGVLIIMGIVLFAQCAWRAGTAWPAYLDRASLSPKKVFSRTM